jgi:uncharacterized protein (TIGR00730 family)
VKRIAVFCGSNVGQKPEYSSAAQELGREIAIHGLGLVYGGGNIGLMGVIADAALGEGGHVTGVIPEALAAKELAHRGVQDLHVVRSMHERKALIAELSEAFIAMPGGVGTLEEFFEVFTWGQLGFHRKPIALLNVAGYYDTLLRFIDQAVAERFVSASHREMLIAESSPGLILDRLVDYQAPVTHKWIDRDEL